MNSEIEILDSLNPLSASVTLISTCQLICTVTQLTGFYMRATLALNGLNSPNISSEIRRRYIVTIHRKKEGAHLTFPPDIFPVQIKSGACYITGQWGRVKNKIK